jgi:cell division protein ZapA (FtsZ GTPase activity inhibitor)
MENRKDQEHEVIGYTVKLRPAQDDSYSPEEVLKMVNEEALAIRSQSPHLDNGQIAVLTALKLAADKMAIEKSYKGVVTEMKSQALEALNLIEEVSPTAHH